MKILADVKPVWLYAAIALLAAYAMWPKYEMVHIDNSGSVIRLNKLTGNVSLCLVRDSYRLTCTDSVN